MLFFFCLLTFFLRLSSVSSEGFFTAEISPSTLTSVPYLNGEITIYEHRGNQSRYFHPPLAIIQLNDTQTIYNRFTNRYSIRLALVLSTEDLHQRILTYLQETLNLCQRPTDKCQIKMIPIDRLRIVWKRLQALSSDYELDSSWMSNTILLSAIHFSIGCATRSACEELRNDTLKHPEIFDGLELEYSTPTEQHLRKDVTITGSNIIQTGMFASLKQMPNLIDSNTRYLMVDDMNTLVSEVIANVEMSDVRDAGYVSHDDQALLRDLLKNRIAINQEVLLGHTSKQWESVYWNSDNLRPDVTVKFLNDELSRKESQYSNEKGVRNNTGIQRYNETSIANGTRSFDDNSSANTLTNNTSGNKYSDTQDTNTHLDVTQSSNTKDIQSSTSTSRFNQQASGSGSTSHHQISHSGGGRSGIFGIGGRGASSSHDSSRTSNYQSSYGATYDADSGSIRNYEDQKDSNVDYKSGSRGRTNAHSFNDNFQQGGSLSDIRARDNANSDYQKLIEMDSFAAANLTKAAQNTYEENRRFLEFNGQRFDVKAVIAYRVNLGQFHDSMKLISKSIVVQRINSTHAVPIRAMGDSTILPPILEEYKINMDKKLDDLKMTLLESVEQKFFKYRQESQTILDQTVLNATVLISQSLSQDTNETDRDLRYLIKKSLTRTMNLQDIGLFDDGILNYYRHSATPIDQITISSLQPLKVALHFSNVSIEGMVCDNQFNINSARLICRIFHNSSKTSLTPRFSTNIGYDQNQTSCLFRTNFVKEYVPCLFILSSLVCSDTSTPINACGYQRPVDTRNRNCRSDEHINVFCEK